MQTIKLKKSLGQNFLINPHIIEKIIKFSDIKTDDAVLEIGTGSGILTRALAKKARLVISYEIDKNLYQIAKQNLKDFKNTHLINEDFLKADITKTFIEKGNFFKVVANLPYYITTPIIEKLLTNKNLFSEIFLTVQKEFAKRIVAKPNTKDYSSFSIFVQYHTEPKILFDISKNNFTPKPKVDSSFIKLDIRKNPFLNIKSEQIFFDIVRRAFNQRRKTLRNALITKYNKNIVDEAMQKSNIDGTRRGETLSIYEFCNLSNELSLLIFPK